MTRSAALDARAATLAVEHVDGPWWRVESASDPDVRHNVRTPEDAPQAAWTCDCQGGRSYCSHKRAVARAIGGGDVQVETQDEPRDNAPRVVRWRGAITDRPTAIQAGGGIEGGGRVVFDVPDLYADALAALIGCRHKELDIVVTVVRR